MFEEIFNQILDSSDGDYLLQAQMLAKMKPSGWTCSEKITERRK